MQLQDAVRRRRAALVSSQKRLQRLQTKIQAFAPEQKTGGVKAIAAKAQGMYDSLVALEQGPSDHDVLLMEMQIETGERVLGFLEQVGVVVSVIGIYIVCMRSVAC